MEIQDLILFFVWISSTKGMVLSKRKKLNPFNFHQNLKLIKQENKEFSKTGSILKVLKMYMSTT